MTLPDKSPPRLKQPPELQAIIDRIHVEAISVYEGFDDRFYRPRYDKNRPFAWYELMLLRTLPGLAQPSAWHEIGGGTGLMPLAMGMMGLNAVNIDLMPTRVAAGLQIRERLLPGCPELAERVQMVAGPFPEAVEGFDTTKAIAITTNFAGGNTDESQLWGRIATMFSLVKARYAGFVFDACLFCNTHREEHQWRRTVEIAREVFGTTPELVHHKDENYSRYYLARWR